MWLLSGFPAVYNAGVAEVRSSKRPRLLRKIKQGVLMGNWFEWIRGMHTAGMCGCIKNKIQCFLWMLSSPSYQLLINCGRSRAGCSSLHCRGFIMNCNILLKWDRVLAVQKDLVNIPIVDNTVMLQWPWLLCTNFWNSLFSQIFVKSHPLG